MATGNIINGFSQADVDKIALEWGNKTKSSIVSTLARLGLQDRGKLIRSIRVQLRQRDGGLESVRFKYRYYGLFHDVGTKKSNKSNTSLPALHWKALAINPEVEILADKLANYYAELTIKNVIKDL